MKHDFQAKSQSPGKKLLPISVSGKIGSPSGMAFRWSHMAGSLSPIILKVNTGRPTLP